MANKKNVGNKNKVTSKKENASVENKKREGIKNENIEKEKVGNKKSKNEAKETLHVKNNQSKKESDKMTKFFNLYEKHKLTIYGFIAGTLLTILVVILIWPDRIAKLEDGREPVAEIEGTVVTADELYEDMKEIYSISLLLNKIDNIILEEKYPETDEMNEEIQEQADNYYNIYEQYYNQDKVAFLADNGFSSESEFLDYLRLDYRRSKYAEEYVESLVTEKEINEYYENEVYGDINTKHILVKVDSSATDEEKTEAENLAKEIISKLDEGKTFDEVREEYKDSITYEELGYKSYNANLESAYLEEMQKLENDSYSKSPVETSYGYHIIYRIDQKEKPALEDVKDEIITSLAEEKSADDSNLYYIALDEMRTDAGLKFSDTVLEKKYNTYMDNYK